MIKDSMDSNSINEHVGSRLRGRRVELKMNQRQLASKIGVSQQQIQKYENGARMGAPMLYSAAQILQVNIEYFFEGDLNKNVLAINDNIKLLSDVTDVEYDSIIEVIQLYQKMSPAMKKNILSIMKELVD